MDMIPYLTGLDNHFSNIRRCGEVGGSAKKIGLRIKELERLYGIELGKPNYEKNSQFEHGGSRRNNCVLKTQEQLAKEMDMDVRTLQNYKMLADMIPELDSPKLGNQKSHKRYRESSDKIFPLPI